MKQPKAHESTIYGAMWRMDAPAGSTSWYPQCRSYLRSRRPIPVSSLKTKVFWLVRSIRRAFLGQKGPCDHRECGATPITGSKTQVFRAKRHFRPPFLAQKRGYRTIRGGAHPRLWPKNRGLEVRSSIPTPIISLISRVLPGGTTGGAEPLLSNAVFARLVKKSTSCPPWENEWRQP